MGNTITISKRSGEELVRVTIEPKGENELRKAINDAIAEARKVLGNRRAEIDVKVTGVPHGQFI